ncbi:MAG: phenylalanine--tRNA ligase subunit beta [Fimbriimonadaceae bacterium]|nr:phenylalanine--tRNA ligase subunit beta [Fimbriimonadaceae bacterium]
MRVPLKWLTDYVDLDRSADELAELLIDLGVGVEEQLTAPGLGGDLLVTEITPNRGDLLSLLGMAREVAAATGRTVRLPAPQVAEDPAVRIADRLTVRVEDPELCPRYAARLVTGLTPGPSPQWLQDRLVAMGQRPIDVLVDVTNYVMFELGQPLHAFDAAKLGDTVVVRRATEGELMVTLDGQKRHLTREQLLITDGHEPVALAGVMGGLDSECSSATRDVVLEAAHFYGPNIRRTARRLGLESESSYRFARTVDPNLPLLALDRAAQLLAECAGGTVASGVIDVKAAALAPRPITLRVRRCNSFLGAALSSAQMAGYLRALGFEVGEADGILQVLVPTRRPDIEREVDLIEEVARLHGYQNLPLTPPPATQSAGGLTDSQRLERRVRELLLGAGLNEVQTFSLTSAPAMAKAGLVADPLEIGALVLQNALSAEFAMLRWSLLPSLLEVVSRNQAQHTEPVRLFEVGRTYAGLDVTVTDQQARAASRVSTGQTASSLPLPCTEERTLGGALLGRAVCGGWNTTPPTAEELLFEAKGIVELVLTELRISGLRVEPRPEAVFEPGRAGAWWHGDQLVGVFGEVAVEVRQRYDIREPLMLFEVNLGWLLQQADTRRVFSALPRQPAALRDIALTVPLEVPSTAVAAVLTSAAGSWLEELRLFDVYRGKGLPAGTRSLAYNLRFRHPQRTLTDGEVDECMAAVVTAVREQCGAALRE